MTLLPRLTRMTLLAASMLAPLTALAAPPAASGTPGPAAAASVTRATLSNGLRVVVVRDPLAPVVQTMVNYETGSVNAPAGFPGTAHALEHMMFNGTPGLSRDQLSAISAQLGGSDNAETQSDVTQYFFQAPAADLDVLLRIEADRMRHLNISDADWKHERGAIEQEVSRDLSSPIYRYISQLQAVLFAGTPYEHDPLGTRASFDATTSTLLRSFYKSWYGPNNAILVITGDVDPQDAIAKVKAAFSDIPAITLPKRAVVSGAPVKAQTLSFDTDLPVSLVTLGWRMPGQRDPDYAAATLLADAITSRRGPLFALVPQGKALEVGFSYTPYEQAGLAIAYAAYPKTLNPSVLRQTLAQVMEGYRQHGIPQELIDAARRQEIAALEYNANSISGLAESWSSALAIQHLQSPEEVIAAFRSVTKAQVDALARKLLDPAHAVSATLMPNDRGKALGGKGYGGAESFNTAPEGPVTLPRWAQAALSQLNIPAASPVPTSYVLPNGLRLLVQPEHVSHTVELFGSIRHNSFLQEPRGKEGVSDLTSSLFLYGSQKHDRLAFERATDDLTVDVSAGPNFSLSSLTPNFEKGLSLLAELELTPAFPERALAITRGQMAQGQAGVLQSPGYKFGRATRQAILPPNDPTLRETTPATISGLTRQDVLDYYAKTYRPDLTTIVVVGDITPQAAKVAVERAFGGWKAVGPTPKVDLPSVPDSTAKQAVVADPGRSQDEVQLIETISRTAQSPDRYALFVGSTILGDGFSSLLMQDLRVKTGYVYSAESVVSLERTRGVFQVSFGADPSKVVAAKDHAIHDVETLRNAPVSADRLTLAKATILRRMPMGGASFGALAGKYLHLVSVGLPLDTPEKAARAVYDLTPQQVQRAFRTWIRPADLSQVVLGPHPH